MTPRPFPLLLASALALLLAGCAAPEESGDAASDPALCGPVQGERGQEPGTTGSGTGDITTADGGDPSRPGGNASTAPGCPTPAP